MVVDVWSWTVVGEKRQAMADFLKRICQYHESQELVLRSYVLHPINGHRDRIYAVAEFESLTTMEQYWPLFWEKGFPQFKGDQDPSSTIEGSSERYQYRSVE